MYWPPNVEGVLWFAQQVFPRVLREVPGAVLTIIGKNPPPALQDLARRAPGSVEVTGYVADPHGYLAETAAFAVPLLSGGGMRVKILDAWAWGLPVVSTTLGAEGIDVRPGEDALIADTPGGFAESCTLLLTRPALRKRIGAAGRAAVRERYDAGRVYDALNEVYAESLGSR
jgi:glycosyltransferase involved in cell wall biosynthesis